MPTCPWSQHGARVHYDTAMVEEDQRAPAPMLIFQEVLEQHRRAGGQTYCKRAREEAVAVMIVANPNFVMKEWALYEVACVRSVARNEQLTREESMGVLVMGTLHAVKE
ncbi:hypothetical protein D1007_28881 [Hordeum vulgare]|nr:hypothetical protein D1007_28881 [Hordeum vulgare]